jgi:hypothetical protein
MRAGEAMTRDVRVVWPDHTVEEAARVTLTIDVGTPLVTQLDAPQSCNGPGLRKPQFPASEARFLLGQCRLRVNTNRLGERRLNSCLKCELPLYSTDAWATTVS